MGEKRSLNVYLKIRDLRLTIKNNRGIVLLVSQISKILNKFSWLENSCLNEESSYAVSLNSVLFFNKN